MPDPLPALPGGCWPIDPACAGEAWEDAEAPDKARAAAMAEQTLRMLTGYRVGGCPITVRPCRAGCSDPTWRTFPALPGAGGVSTPWFPVTLGGTWLNIGCGHGTPGCGCDGLAEVTLPMPCSAVTAVKVDGIVLDPTAYRLDRGGRLVRLDAARWPLCQNMDAPDTEVGTWSVTYRPGEPVDGLGAAAAGALAGEYLSACSGVDCALPSGVVQIVRQGVTITLGADLFPNGRTGIPTVDAFIHRWNPHALKAPSMVYSPDLRRAR